MRFVIVHALVEDSPKAQALGAARVAAVLAEAGTCTVFTCLSSDAPQEVLERFLPPDLPLPDAIGFSLYLWNRPLLEALARQIRLDHPGILLFAGGVEVRANLTSMQAEGFFDTLVPGEGEAAARILLEHLRAGQRPPALIQGTLSVMDELPSPYPFVHASLVRHQAALWELTRGCPYACTYCYESRGEKSLRRIGLDRAAAELAELLAAGVRHLVILDPTFNADSRRCIALLELFAQKAPQIHYDFEIRAELLNAEQAAAFSRLDCSLQIGLQSSLPQVLAAVGRNFDPARFADRLGLLDEYGLVYGLDLIYGLPKDTLDGFRSSLDWALRRRPNHLDVFRLAVLPGTIMAENAGLDGLVASQSPPYLLQSSPSFPADDLNMAETLAKACDLVYNRARSVAWFEPWLRWLRLPPTAMLDAAVRAGLPQTMPEPWDAARWTADLANALCLAKGEAAALFSRELVLVHGAWAAAWAEGSSLELSLCHDPHALLETGAAMPGQYCGQHRPDPARTWRFAPGRTGVSISPARGNPRGNARRQT